jgi:hypothetical protein
MQTSWDNEPNLIDFHSVSFSAILGGGGSAGCAESPDDPQSVHAWFAARLTDHEEVEPGNWFREQEGDDGWVSYHRIIVQPRHAWTPDPRDSMPNNPDSRTIVTEYSARYPPQSADEPAPEDPPSGHPLS